MRAKDELEIKESPTIRYTYENRWNYMKQQRDMSRVQIRRTTGRAEQRAESKRNTRKGQTNRNTIETRPDSGSGWTWRGDASELHEGTGCFVP